MFAQTYGYYRTSLGRHSRSSGWGVARFDLVAQFEPYRNNSWLAPARPRSCSISPGRPTSTVDKLVDFYGTHLEN